MALYQETMKRFLDELAALTPGAEEETRAVRRRSMKSKS